MAMNDMGAMPLKIRTMVADDEQLARQKLRLLLEGEPWVQIVAECINLMSTQAGLRDYKPDLLFLDIEMPGGSGFDALQGLGPDETPIVIFTTAYDRYAVRAFEMHALDYLLKPFDQSRLHEAVERARVELLRSKDRVFTSQLLELLKVPALGSPTADDRLIIKAGGRFSGGMCAANVSEARRNTSKARFAASRRPGSASSETPASNIAE